MHDIPHTATAAQWRPHHQLCNRARSGAARSVQSVTHRQQRGAAAAACAMTHPCGLMQSRDYEEGGVSYTESLPGAVGFYTKDVGGSYEQVRHSCALRTSKYGTLRVLLDMRSAGTQ